VQNGIGERGKHHKNPPSRFCKFPYEDKEEARTIVLASSLLSGTRICLPFQVSNFQYQSGEFVWIMSSPH